MSEDKTIHLVRHGGKDGGSVIIWCGRYNGVNLSGLDYINPSSKTKFRAVHPDDPAFGPTCGACRRSVGMLKQPREPDMRQRYRPRKQNG